MLKQMNCTFKFDNLILVYNGFMVQLALKIVIDMVLPSYFA